MTLMDDKGLKNAINLSESCACSIPLLSDETAHMNSI